MDAHAYPAARERVVEAIWRDLDPLEDEIETSGRIDYATLWPRLRAMGAFGLLIPEEYGGWGLSVAQYLPILAEFAKIQGGIRILVHAHNSMAYNLLALGNERQRREVLPGAATGEHSVAFALTEPDHGTGADTGTTARREGASYVLDGRKWLITNADFASHFIVFAKTAPGRAATAVSVFLVPRETPGLTMREMPELMGCRGGQHCEMTFAEAREASGGESRAPSRGGRTPGPEEAVARSGGERTPELPA